MWPPVLKMLVSGRREFLVNQAMMMRPSQQFDMFDIGHVKK